MGQFTAKRIAINFAQRGDIVAKEFPDGDALVLRPSKFEGHCPMIRHGCRMALMVALN
ncbi:MAG: hypothetical protein BECKG1743F_GA0114225_105021, partial [Candidatus Kentron sp. G]